MHISVPNINQIIFIEVVFMDQRICTFFIWIASVKSPFSMTASIYSPSGNIWKCLFSTLWPDIFFFVENNSLWYLPIWQEEKICSCMWLRVIWGLHIVIWVLDNFPSFILPSVDFLFDLHKIFGSWSYQSFIWLLSFVLRLEKFHSKFILYAPSIFSSSRFILFIVDESIYE